jgi:hypothetical protein
LVPLAPHMCLVTWGYTQANRSSVVPILPTTTAQSWYFPGVNRELLWHVLRTQSARRAMSAHTVRPPAGGAERRCGTSTSRHEKSSVRDERRPTPSASWQPRSGTGSTPVSGVGADQRIDEFDGHACHAESSDQDDRSVRDSGDRLVRVGAQDGGHDRSPVAATFSSTTASLWPTPMQIAAPPQRLPVSISRLARVPRIRPPEAPSGWPMAITPPLALTSFGSIRQAWMQASDWTAKASFSSTAPMSDQLRPVRRKAFSVAYTGAMPKSRGSFAATPRPAIRANGSEPITATAVSEPIRTADAPSFSGEALPAVMVPSGR